MLPTPRREYVFGAGFSRARAIAQSKVVFSVPLGIAHDANVRREDSTCRPKLPGNAVALILAYMPLPAGVRTRRRENNNFAFLAQSSGLEAGVRQERERERVHAS